ncbi:MAG: aromatic aminobenezylarsenical efflux permease ArsG family transporter [Candidatus Methanofastidiosia archaeon]
MIPGFIEHFINDTSFPLLSSFFIGLATAISPCTFAANVAAVSYIAHNADKPSRALLTGIFFSIGRIVAYFALGAVMISAGKVIGDLARGTQTHGNLIMGPVLIVIGLWFAGLFEVDFSVGQGLIQRFGRKLSSKGYLGALILGGLFAFAFCPYSGMLFFGILIPLTISSSGGIMFPIIFGLGVNVPVLIFTVFLYFSTTKARSFGKALTSSWRYLGKAIGWIILATGCYYLGPYVDNHFGITFGFYITLVFLTLFLAGAYYLRSYRTRRNVVLAKEAADEVSVSSALIQKKRPSELISLKESDDRDVEKVLDTFVEKLSNADTENFFALKREFSQIEKMLLEQGKISDMGDKIDICITSLANLLEKL